MGYQNNVELDHASHSTAFKYLHIRGWAYEGLTVMECRKYISVGVKKKKKKRTEGLGNSNHKNGEVPRANET